ncbi:phosphonate ABC transporter, permease protein PhnE [Thermus thermophilus]|uniref:phosphonate ABC transporter, permease protein PhnE n=1 Tax=Thermus thermophilus TaxID=274 RepID=UPI001FCC442E|nr:phosphonate ABC transporter, permease protein PhnE [Thermus thermophilus]
MSALWMGFNPLALGASLGKSLEFAASFWPPSLVHLPQFLRSLLETVAMALWGSFLATFLAVPLALLGSRNVVGSGALYLFARGAMDFLRGFPEIVLALIFVAALGLGPLPGILALTLHTAGVVGKLLSEAIETVDPGQVEAVRATGAHPLLVVAYGIWPQVAPLFASVTLYHFEVNVRSATVLGLVGAGGIGFDLMQTVRAFRFHDAATVILLILLAVFLIDKLSARLRRALL